MLGFLRAYLVSISFYRNVAISCAKISSVYKPLVRARTSISGIQKKYFRAMDYGGPLQKEVIKSYMLTIIKNFPYVKNVIINNVTVLIEISIISFISLYLNDYSIFTS